MMKNAFFVVVVVVVVVVRAFKVAEIFRGLIM